MRQANEIMQILDQKIYNNSILIFDLDGTLVNSNYANFLSYQRAIQLVLNTKIKFPHCCDERFTRKTLTKKIPELNDIECEKIIELKNKIYSEHLNNIDLNVLAAKILNKYFKTNKLILATNSRKERAIMVLRHYELMDMFEYKFYKEDVNETNKFEYVLTTLGIPPLSAIIFENEKSEINAAIHSGIPNENIFSI